DPVHVCGRDAGPIVTHAQAGDPVLALQPHLDVPAVVGVLDGVVDQDPEQLLDRVGVAHHGDVVGPVQPDLAIARHRLRLAGDVADDRLQLHGGLVQVLAGVGPGQGGQVLHHPAHPLALAGDVLEGGAAVLAGDVVALQ